MKELKEYDVNKKSGEKMKFMNVKPFFKKYWPQNIVKEYNTHVKIILEKWRLIK